ncbi:MAG: Sec-independent protein translocase protein TatB [Hyphomicrobiales bacterium]
MFDFGVGYTEMVVIALVAIIVIGPKDLPRVLRGLGRMMNKMRGMAREFQGHMDAAMKEAGLDEVKRDLQSLKNPITSVKDSVTSELNKQDESFKKYFGTMNDAAKATPMPSSTPTTPETSTPAVADGSATATPAVADASATPAVPVSPAKVEGEPTDLKQAS